MYIFWLNDDKIPSVLNPGKLEVCYEKTKKVRYLDGYQEVQGNVLGL